MLTHRDRLKHSFFLFHPSPWIVETLLVCTLIAVATLLQRRLRVLPPTFSPLQMSKLQGPAKAGPCARRMEGAGSHPSRYPRPPLRTRAERGGQTGATRISQEPVMRHRSVLLSIPLVAFAQTQPPKVWDDRALGDWATPIAAL